MHRADAPGRERPDQLTGGVFPLSPAAGPCPAPAGVIVILATQRPSHQVIDPSMRDLFGYRWAFRCTTDSSSDVVLGHGWASEGYTAASIDPLARGVGWLLSETGVPRRIKAAYLEDDDIKYLARYAAKLRHGTEAAA